MRYALAGAAFLFLINFRHAAADQQDAQSAVKSPAEVTAILIDGRQITGRVAATTDDVRLDLHVASQRVSVTSHLSWQQVDSFRVDEQQVSVAQFRQTLDRFILSEPPTRIRPTKPLSVVPLTKLQNHANRHSERSGGQNTHRADSKMGRSSLKETTSIQIDARIANWDRDPAADGLLLELYVLNDGGHPLRVPGRLTAKLVGLRQQITVGQLTLDREPPVADLESWSQPLRAADFADGVAIVKLPFRRLVPERDLDISAFTLLQVSYGVSSVGVFKASQSDVLIRHPSVFRDDLFLSTGHRVLPIEGGTTYLQRNVPALRRNVPASFGR